MSFMPPTTRAVRAPIVLDRDPARRAKLLEKYALYVRRCGYPEVSPTTDFEDYMRCMLIVLLFANEVIDLAAFEEQYRDHAWFNQNKFVHAALIVGQYNDGVLK